MLDISFTQSAIDKIHQVLSEDKNIGKLFRIKVESGGCSGLQYRFCIDGHINKKKIKNKMDDDLFADEKDDENDYMFTDNNDKSIAVIDSNSLKYLKGSTVDYISDLTKCDFVITNPNAASKCGCNNSFSVK